MRPVRRSPSSVRIRRAGLSGRAGKHDREASLTRSNQREIVVLLCLGRAMHQGQCRHRVTHERHRRRGVPKRLGGDGGIEHLQAGAAEALRDQQAVQAEFSQAMPKRFVVAAAFFRECSKLLHRQPVGEERTQRVVELTLFQ